MRELDNLVSEIREVRKEKIRERMVEDPIKEYVKEILKAFKVSNEQKKSAVLLWQIKCMGGMNRDYIIFALSFENGDDVDFYSISDLKEGKAGKIGNNYELIEYVDGLIIPKVAFNDIYEYLKNHIYEEDFNVTLNRYTKDIIIELKE